MRIYGRPPLLRGRRALLALLATVAGSTPAVAATTYQPSIPSQLLMTVRETAGVARSNEVLTSGLPLPRAMNVRSTGALAVVDAAGHPVPAQFTVTARWNAGLGDPTSPIQWVLVDFPAIVPAGGSAIYRLVTDGTVHNPAPAQALAVSQSGGTVTVATGAATFRLGTDPDALFDDVSLASGARLAGGGPLTVDLGSGEVRHSTTRRAWIERAGPLAAVVVVEGQYDAAAIGGGGIGSRRRYVFTAGSPTALVRQSAAWEGTLDTSCPSCNKLPNGTVNGVRIDRLRDHLPLVLGGPATVTAVGAFAAPAVVQGAGTQPAWVRQQRRASRTAPLAFDVNVAGAQASGAKADGGVLAASGPAGTVAIALSHMHRFEPQALRLLTDGSLAIDLADNSIWLAHHQGVFANLAVAALPAAAARADLDARVWAPLNHPLHAWPQAAWFAASGAVEELPSAALPASLAGYDVLIPAVLNRTLSQVDVLGTAGLMTYGVFPRYWGVQGSPGEIDCQGSADPTPNDHWDDTFWCATWTDYHSTAASAATWAMRSGQTDWLDEVAFPAAERVLHTQMMQCAPGDPWFYCGQAPSGYGGYRADFNSSHAYFENLFLYYWLTGDHTVIDTLQLGGERMRRWMCETRGPLTVYPANGPGGPACAATFPARTDLTGRVGEQWFSAFRFLGLASADASFLDDFRSGLSRVVTQYYVEASRGGVNYGFVTHDIVSGNRATTDQWWMTGFYDLENLYRLERDSGDAPIGVPPLAPSHVLAAVAHSVRDIEEKIAGDGTPKGIWPLKVDLTWSGARVGGTLLSSTVSTDPAERPMYAPEKAAFTAFLVRVGEETGEATILQKGQELTLFDIGAATGEGAPLGKLEGQHLTRLHAAVAHMASESSTPASPPPPPPPPPGGTGTGTGTGTGPGSGSTGTGGAGGGSTGTGTGGGSPAPPPANTPAAPTLLAAKQLPGNQVMLTWRDNATNETEYHVEVQLGSVFVEHNVLGPNATSFTLSGFAPGVTHAFRVRARNAAGYSSYSNVATSR